MALTNADIVAFFGKVSGYPEVKTVTAAHLTRLQTMLNREMNLTGADADDAGVFIYRYLRERILYGEDSLAADQAQNARPTEL